MRQITVSEKPDGLRGLRGSEENTFYNNIFEDYLGQLRKKYDLSGKVVLIHCPTFSFKAFSKEVAQKKDYYAYPPSENCA